MTLLIVSLVLLGLVSAAIGYFSKEDSPVVTGRDCSTCNGEDERCEMECRLEAAVKDIEYYDDWDLDLFKGRASDSYNEDEVAQFADVLYTLQPKDLKGWMRSLSLRGIELPDELKSDLFLLLDS